MGGYQTISLTDRDAVRIITMNRPDIYNPLDSTSASELTRALEETDRDPEIKTLVLTGAGKAFSGGGNLKVMAQALESGEKPGLFFSGLVAVFNRLIITMRRLQKPLVCAVNGGGQRGRPGIGHGLRSGVGGKHGQLRSGLHPHRPFPGRRGHRLSHPEHRSQKSQRIFPLGPTHKCAKGA